MHVIPAIDVRAGRCVRLRRGDFADETVFAADPVAVAERFIDAGASRLHVVDLDSARGIPLPDSTDAVTRVVSSAVARGCAVQVGGGVRSVETARHWTRMGADCVIIGSVAARDWPIALEICHAVHGRVLLSLDVHAGMSRTDGWTRDGAAMTELLRAWHDWPARGLIYTDTARDGMLLGPNLAGLRTCLETYAGTVFVSGGISSVDDISACQSNGAAGVVIGRAVYEGTIDLPTALRAFPGSVA
jgi:phosphoribosylformimino-5-aminoimidazole carboxamide ribotide isomerase